MGYQNFLENRISHKAIGAAIEVHRFLGPGLLESAYRDGLARELTIRGITFEKERTIQVSYKGAVLPGYRADLIIEGRVILELKAVMKMEPVFFAQVLSYLKATGLKLGLLINFNVANLSNGIYRIVNNL